MTAAKFHRCTEPCKCPACGPDVHAVLAVNEALVADRDEWQRLYNVSIANRHAVIGSATIRAEKAEAERDELRELLGSIWLYVKWRWVTKQLTTRQKELWADAVDADTQKGQIEDGEEPHPVAERWWRDDARANRRRARDPRLPGDHRSPRLRVAARHASRGQDRPAA